MTEQQQGNAASAIIAIAFLLVAISITVIWLIPELAAFVDTTFNQGVTLREAAVVSLITSIAMLIVFTLAWRRSSWRAAVYVGVILWGFWLQLAIDRMGVLTRFLIFGPDLPSL